MFDEDEETMFMLLLADWIAATAALRVSVPQCAVVLISLYNDATMNACSLSNDPGRETGRGSGPCWPQYAK